MSLIVFHHYEGLFAARDIAIGELICLTAGCLVTEASRADTESVFIWVAVQTNEADDFDGELNTWFDAEAFKDVVLHPNRVGHFANTSDPCATIAERRIPTGEYRLNTARTDNDTTESVIALYATKDMRRGDEILADYHWQLAAMRKTARAYSCECKRCKGTCECACDFN